MRSGWGRWDFSWFSTWLGSTTPSSRPWTSRPGPRPIPTSSTWRSRSGPSHPSGSWPWEGPGAGQDVKPGMYGLELAAGHHPNDLARYRELIGMAGSGVPANLINPSTLALDLPILSILNVRYVIWPVYQFGGLPQGEAVMATTLGGGRPYEAVYEIPTLPRARLVKEVVVLPEEETMDYLLSPGFQPENEIVLNEQPALAPPPRPRGGGGHLAGEDPEPHTPPGSERLPGLPGGVGELVPRLEGPRGGPGSSCPPSGSHAPCGPGASRGIRGGDLLRRRCPAHPPPGQPGVSARSGGPCMVRGAGKGSSAA